MVKKLEKSLHAGNIAAAFGVFATAADMTLAAGAGTTISALLSGIGLFKPSNKTDKPALEKLTQLVQRALDQSHMTEDRKKIALQMLAKFPPTYDDMAAGNLDAKTVAGLMRKQAEENATDPEHRMSTALKDYEDTLRHVLGAILDDDSLNNAVFKKLLLQGEASGQSDRLRDEGITERAIVRLAQRVARDTTDVGQAWLELNNAMDIAVRVQQEGDAPSNHRDFVDEVLARTKKLAADGEYETALDEIDAVLAEEAARRVRLLERGVELAVLAGNAARTADLAAEQLWQDLPEDADRFAALRAIWIEWNEQGRDKGLNFDAAVAIHLAERSCRTAGDKNERGAALNDLGIALAELGKRESSSVRLAAAVMAYENALKERTREAVPLQWAMTQNNLGNALAELGAREGDPARLAAAVTAYKNALKEYTRGAVPLEWATTQNNLGNALAELGAREGDPARLKAAVTAYENALRERTREVVPLDWATTQNNLGTALQELGAREGDPVRLKAAVTAYENALRERTREVVPLDWATTQNNLGNALAKLGAREGDPARLKAAVTAYENALKERTREAVPLQWAMTQGNLANVELAYFELNGDPKHLDKAKAYVLVAREVFEEAQATQYVSMADQQLAWIAEARGGKAKG